MREYIAIIAAIIGLITAIVSLTNSIKANQASQQANQASQQAKEISVNNKASILSMSNELLSVKDRLRAVAPPTEPALPSHFFVDGMNNVIYADFEDQISQVKLWLNNPHSGYPSLKNTLQQLLAKRCPKGNPVSLIRLNAHYLGNTSQPAMQHDLEQLRGAYIQAWKEKNSGSSLGTFEDMAPQC